jgi:hypothetical protein
MKVTQKLNTLVTVEGKTLKVLLVNRLPLILCCMEAEIKKILRKKSKELRDEYNNAKKQISRKESVANIDQYVACLKSFASVIQKIDLLHDRFHVIQKWRGDLTSLHVKMGDPEIEMLDMLESSKEMVLAEIEDIGKFIRSKKSHFTESFEMEINKLNSSYSFLTDNLSSGEFTNPTQDAQYILRRLTHSVQKRLEEFDAQLEIFK